MRARRQVGIRLTVNATQVYVNTTLYIPLLACFHDEYELFALLLYQYQKPLAGTFVIAFLYPRLQKNFNRDPVEIRNLFKVDNDQGLLPYNTQ